MQDNKPFVLVTGGVGYIGSHTVVELQNSGYRVVIIDNLSNSDIKVLSGIEKITGIKPVFENFDLCDEKLTENFFNKYPVQAIIHFAALKAVGESVTEPLKYYRNNIFSLINLLTAIKKHEIPFFVFSSSCTVYGEPEKLPVTEEAPIKTALSPYGNTKQVSEEILRDFVNSMGSRFCIALRYFNPIGAHKSALIGELPLGIPNNLVPFITQAAIGKREILHVFGNDYNTPDGTCIRDYINVVDLAKAHVAALGRMLGNKCNANFEVYNLGTGMGTSVLEIIHSFEKIAEKKLNYKITGRRTGDVEKVFAATDKANSVLGWKAEISLEETLLSAWNWEIQLSKNACQ